MILKDLQGILRDNGIVGAGGAGFPTYAKLSEKAYTVIENKRRRFYAAHKLSRKRKTDSCADRGN